MENDPLNEHEQKALDFARRNAGKWHSFANDSLTRETIYSLAQRKLVNTNEFQQFCFILNGPFDKISENKYFMEQLKKI